MPALQAQGEGYDVYAVTDASGGVSIEAHKMAMKAQERVHMRDGQGVSIAAMATAAGPERRTLPRRFAAATGMTPIEYCRAVRIARARELLEGGDTSQKQIAQSLGYKDVASFARVFRKAVGSTPGTYRKRFGRNGISPTDFSMKDSFRQRGASALTGMKRLSSGTGGQSL
jgi:AraC-like DNA-binding protein